MTKKRKAKLDTSIDLFCKEQAERFSDLFTKKFLKAYFDYHIEGKHILEEKGVRRINSAYAIALPLFEGMVECRCGHKFNGHHVAQKFAKIFK